MFLGYCTIHDILTVCVFESDYADRRSIRDNLMRCIEDTYGIAGASFDFEVYRDDSADGQNVWEIAQQAAIDCVGSYGYQIESEYRLDDQVMKVSKLARCVASDLASDYTVDTDTIQTLLDSMCAVFEANDEEDVRNDLASLLSNMVNYYN